MAPTENPRPPALRALESARGGGGHSPGAAPPAATRAASASGCSKNCIEERSTFSSATHALFQEGVEFRDLALAIVDEQHRFGVHQRLALAEKGEAPTFW